MKILYHHRVASRDGQSVHIDEMIDAFRSLGHEVIVVCPRVSAKESVGSDGGVVPYLKRYIPQAIYELLELSYSVIACVKLIHAVRKHKPDCLYERYNLYMVAGIWTKRITGLPIVLEVNAPVLDEREKFGGIALPGIARKAERYVWKNADVVLPVTNVLGKRIAKEGVPDSDIYVIPNGINPQRIKRTLSNNSAKRSLGLDSRFVLGFTGFVREWHQLDSVIELLNTDVDGNALHLLLVGDGPARQELESLADELGVRDRLTVTGVVQRDQIVDLVSAFDIALQPHVVPYASPLKIFEYLALGRPIVAPNSANIREILTNGENALLFEPDVEGALEDAISSLCDEPSLRAHLSKGAASTIEERGFTWLHNARAVSRLIEQLGAKGRLI